MKIIILIISSESTHYNQMKEIWKKYMNEHENIKCFFIEFNDQITEDIVLNETKNIIYIKGLESYIPGILDKTIKSIQYLVSQNIEFDYILRTNLSTFVVLDKLYNYLEVNKIDYAGPLGIISDKIEYKKYLDHIDKSNKYFPSGTGILMSKIVINKLLSNTPDYNLIDDLSIGLILSKYYKFNILKRQDFINRIKNNEINLDYDLFLYRCKYKNNEKNIITLNKLLNYYYNII
jgi:hypothetical protein